MLKFTTEITLGNIAIVVTLITIAISIGQKIGTLSTTVVQHAAVLDRHAMRMDKYEERLIVIVGDMQRMIGRVEATQDRIDRLTGNRKGEGGFG
jgi:hypothetical protein